MDDVKYYYPDTIEQQQLNSEAVESIDPTGSTSNKTAGSFSTYNADSIPQSKMITKKIAQELVNDSLNTISRQVLGEYQFSETGAIAIGKYKPGVSGQIKISPSGIVGINSSGETTFAIDGQTGNATFKGTISAGSVISASISAGNITGQIVNAQILSVDFAKITSVSIGTAQIANGAITNAKIANATIESAKIVSIDANKINVGTLTGFTIIGGTIKTSSGSGQRVVINGTDNQIEFYDSSNNFCGRLLGLSSAFVITGGNVDKVRFPDKTDFEDTVTIDAPLNVNSISMVGGIDMNGAEISEIKELKFNDTNSNYNNDTWEIWAYNSSEDGFRCRVNGNLYQFDLTSK